MPLYTATPGRSRAPWAFTVRPDLVDERLGVLGPATGIRGHPRPDPDRRLSLSSLLHLPFWPAPYNRGPTQHGVGWARPW